MLGMLAAGAVAEVYQFVLSLEYSVTVPLNEVVAKFHLLALLVTALSAAVRPLAAPSNCIAAYNEAESANVCASFFVMYTRPTSIAKPAMPNMPTAQTADARSVNPRWFFRVSTITPLQSDTNIGPG